MNLGDLHIIILDLLVPFYNEVWVVSDHTFNLANGLWPVAIHNAFPSGREAAVDVPFKYWCFLLKLINPCHVILV